ncbi:hypothetical protein [Altererythrobacter sp. GH1-8]|uniref:hypothetical protein n=1 Tax=Altererythrobacter sp. GH1-8 TaxID=3349333 RepID=UPI00374D61F8
MAAIRTCQHSGRRTLKRPPTKPDPSGTAINRSSRLDGDDLDAANPKKRKPRKRSKPAKELQAKKDAMVEHLLSLPYPPGVILEPAGMDQEYWTAPHSDIDLWTAQLAHAFGTRSQAVITTFMDQLERLCERRIWDEEAYQWRLDEHEFSAALAIINSTKPENEVQAMLAAQIVAVNMMQMRLAARSLRYDGDHSAALVATKLARTFNDQLRLLEELKGRGRKTQQSIKVEKELHQHVHYHDHREEEKNKGQPHEQRDETSAQITDQRETLRSEDESGRVVQMPCDKRA